MIPISAATRVYLAVGATDLRKGFEGLSDLARQILEVDPIRASLHLLQSASHPDQSAVF